MVVIADSSIPFVEEAFADFGEVRTMPGRDITSQQLKEATILLVRSITTVDKNLLEGTGVKFVATATIGTDHIDTAYLAENNIGFAYAPGSNAESVAEYITAALFELTQARGRKLNELALGIVGCGNIGSRVFRHAQALGMHCLLNDPPKKRISGSISYLPLEKVLRESDIVSLHVPLNMHGSDATYHMV
ncbi:MAG: NAD(P)-dependent oxidoreductase, partial [Fibrobacterota bacterium]